MSPEINFSTSIGSSSSYKFLGWYDASDSNKTIITSIPKGSTGNRVLKAKWEEVKNATIDIGLDIPTETLYIKNMGNSEDGITLKAMDSDGTSYTSYTWFVEGIELSDETGYLLVYDPTEDGYEADDVLSIMVLAIDENERVHSCTIQVVVQ